MSLWEHVLSMAKVPCLHPAYHFLSHTLWTPWGHSEINLSNK